MTYRIPTAQDRESFEREKAVVEARVASAHAFADWQQKWFPRGSVHKSKLQQAFADDISRYYRPFWELELAHLSLLPDKPTPCDDWFEGLRAFALVFSEALIRQEVDGLQTTGGKISIENYEKILRSGGRTLFGKDAVSGFFIDRNGWDEDRTGVALWANAMSNVRPDSAMAARFFLARGWDCEFIPLRYFSDWAQIQYLREVLLHNRVDLPSHLNVEKAETPTSYDKDIRNGSGKRRFGLGLKNKPDPVVIEFGAEVKIVRKNAERHGFALSFQEWKDLRWDSRVFVVAN